MSTRTKAKSQYGFEEQHFEQPSVTVDIVIFALSQKKLHVLMIERGISPYKGMWALPGGFVKTNESLETAARRELKEETSLSIQNAYLEQLYTFGAPKRDPRKRVITVAHMALLPETDPKIQGASDAKVAAWHSIDRLPPLAFDHKSIVRYAKTRLQYKLEYTNAAFGLLSREFTLTELQQVYEVIFEKEFDKRNFRKKFLSLNLLKNLPRQKMEGAHRPATLYSFKSRNLVYMDILQSEE